METTFAFKSIVKQDLSICHVNLIAIFLRQQLNANVFFSMKNFFLLLGKGVFPAGLPGGGDGAAVGL